MHVVDATGQSDKDGNVLGKGETGPSPCRLISVHCIVYMSFLFPLSSSHFPPYLQHEDECTVVTLTDYSPISQYSY